MAEFFGDDVARNPAVSDTPGHPAEFQTQTMFVMSYRTLHAPLSSVPWSDRALRSKSTSGPLNTGKIKQEKRPRW